MKQWLKDNWDKLLGFVMSVVIAGVVGFFSAIRATEGQISDLKAKVATLEADSNNLLKPKIGSLDTLRAEHDTLQRDMKLMEKNDNIQRSTHDLINLIREEEKRRTVNELKELLNPKQP